MTQRTEGLEPGHSGTQDEPRAMRSAETDSGEIDTWEQYLHKLESGGLTPPAHWLHAPHSRATADDEAALYAKEPSFVDRLPWVEFLSSGALLLEDGRSVAACFEIIPISTEGRDVRSLEKARDALENALQDSFEEHDEHPWIVQWYVQDETGWDDYRRTLRAYIHDRAKGTAFTECYLKVMDHHLRSISKPGGLYTDQVVTQLPWRGQTRRVRMVIYRWVSTNATRGSLEPEQALQRACERFTGALANAGIKAQRLAAADVHAWLLRWFHPQPTHLGDQLADQERFYALTTYPRTSEDGALELASGTDFAQRLFFGKPRSDLASGTWYFDRMPHRVVVLDRLRAPPVIGHVTGEMRNGDATNAMFDRVPEGTIMCITLVITPQDGLEAHLARLGRKSVGATVASEQTRQDVQQARTLMGSSHKLYQAAMAFYIRGRDRSELDARSRKLANVLLDAGLQPVRDEDEVAPLNTYIRWLPCVFNPAKDPKHWYTQLAFVQHVAHLLPLWGRSRGTGHPGITFFNRGGETLTYDSLNRLDRLMNAHLFLCGETGAGKSATLSTILHQVTAVYRPRIFVVEAGNSFGLFGDFAERLGLTVHRVKLAPGADVTLAPFAESWRLVSAGQLHTLDVDALGEEDGADSPNENDTQRDVLGELEITARIMITGGEEKEEARMSRADRSLIRRCIVDAAERCASAKRTVLTEDVREALIERSHDTSLPDVRRARLLEMADAIDIFCQGGIGDLFNRPGTAWPEADITIVDLATFAREGYEAELAAAYVSLINHVNNIAERDQYLGRPIIMPTDEGHIIIKHPLISPFKVKITKMWRKLNACFWLSTHNLGDFPRSAEALLKMIETWMCLGVPPEEIEKITRFRELTPEQKALLLSARKEPGKYTEGVLLSKSVDALFRVVPPSLHLALAMTDPEEKHERYQIMKRHQVSELDAALHIAERIDRARGITPMVLNELAHSQG
jgi:conjugative transfer ATPase